MPPADLSGRGHKNLHQMDSPPNTTKIQQIVNQQLVKAINQTQMYLGSIWNDVENIIHNVKQFCYMDASM